MHRLMAATGSILIAAWWITPVLAGDVPVLQAATVKVGQFEKIEFQLQVPGTYANPFDPDEVDLTLVITGPGARRVTLPAFWGQDYERRSDRGGRDWMYPAGPPAWKARFAPLDAGSYQAVAVLRDRRGVRQSAAVAFACVPSGRKGFLQVSRKDPRYLEGTDGTPFFAIGQNLAFIGESQHINLSRAETAFARLGENGCNFLRVWACCEDWALAVEARKSAWGRSWSGRLPLVSVPDTQSADGERRCVPIGDRERKTIEVSPSHPVSLRPGTHYVLIGKIRTEARTSVHVELANLKRPVVVSSQPAGRWEEFRAEFVTGTGEFWLGRLSLRREGAGQAWIDGLSLKEAAGGPELLWEADVHRPVRGFYNPLDCFMLDEIVAAAEKSGLKLQLCLLTRDLYMNSLRNDTSPAYKQAIEDAKKLFRYAVARWGSSTSVAVWEYFNEIDPGVPTDRFYTEVGEYLDRIDPYRHPRTTSTWAPSPRNSRHPRLEIAQEHFYYRPVDRKRYRDEVEAAVARVRDLRQGAPLKPILLGEIGVANDRWQPTEEMKTSRSLEEFHNLQWSSALAGGSGTALYWWWDRFDRCQGYPRYRPLSRYLADIPWTTARLQPTSARVSPGQVRVVGLQGRDQVYLWLFNPQASWEEMVVQRRQPRTVSGAQVTVAGLDAGTYRVQWWDTRTGEIIREERVRGTAESLPLRVPDFDRDLACKVIGH